MKYNGKEIVKVAPEKSSWGNCGTCTGCVFSGEDDCDMDKAKEFMEYDEIERKCELDEEGKPAHVIYVYVE